MISIERLEELRKVVETPAEMATGEWENARAALADSVPELLDTIEELNNSLKAVRAKLIDFRAELPRMLEEAFNASS